MKLNLENKHFLVTGGAKGIGASVVKLLKMEKAKVFVIDKENANQGEAIDVRDSKKVYDFIKKMPKLDGLVLNAGLGPFHEDSVAIFETNVIGTLNVLKACKEKLTDFSSIVIISSTAGYRNKWDDKWLQYFDFQKKPSFDYKAELKHLSPEESYRLTKWLLIQATKKFAKDFANKKIRVNCVAPGPTKTEMSKSLWTDNLSEWKKIISENPFNLANDTSDVAPIILYLLSKHTKMITGSFLHVDGGWFATKALNNT